MNLQSQQALYEERWLESETGQFIFSRQEKLVSELILPEPGESVLDLGCLTGNFIKIFLNRNCDVTGIDESPAAIEFARKKLNARCELVCSSLKHLPFSDNQFDIVALTHGLYLSNDPQRIIAEAVRVSRDRILVGFLNKYCLVGTKHAIKKLFGFPPAFDPVFFSAGEIQSIIGDNMYSTPRYWGSVIYLPKLFYTSLTEFEEIFPVQKNPFGAYVGMVFPVNYTYKTVQNPVLNSFGLKSKNRATAPEAVRGMLRRYDR